MLARLRRWYWKHVRRHDGETCTSCGRAYWHTLGETWWEASSAAWRVVVGADTELRCPRCFTRQARAKGIHIRWQAVAEGE